MSEDEDSERRYRPLIDASGAPLDADDADDADDHDADADDDRDAPFGGPIVDLRTRRLLNRFASEPGEESVEPDRNWSPLIAVAIGVVVVVLAGLAASALISGSDDDPDTDGLAGRTGGDRPSVLDEDAPSLEDLTADVTVPPGPDRGLQVAAEGVTIVPDRFDETKREGTYAVVIENPHAEWLAQGVEVDVRFLDASGFAVGEDSGFVEVVLPAQRVAVASLIFDAPSAPIADLEVTIDVARWRQTGPVAGEFVVTGVQTGSSEFSGVRTTFTIESRFDAVLTDVGITAVYKAADGRIIGGYDTFVDRLEPGAPTTATIDLLANVDPAQIDATELYPTAAFGSVPGD